jgi:hypothetical protein
LWNQLGFAACQTLQDIEASTTAAARDMLPIALSRTVSLEAPRTDCQHQICYHTPPADVTPPCLVTVIELNVVRLELEFSTKLYPSSLIKRKRSTKDSGENIRRHESHDDLKLSDRFERFLAKPNGGELTEAE